MYYTLFPEEKPEDGEDKDGDDEDDAEPEDGDEDFDGDEELGEEVETSKGKANKDKKVDAHKDHCF